MSPWLEPVLGGGAMLAGLGSWLRRRLIAPLLVLLVAASVSVAIWMSRSTGPGAALSYVTLGSLELSRLNAGVLIGGWAALVLQLGVIRRPGLSTGGAGVACLAGLGSSLALATTGLAPLALLLASISGLIWGRWLRLTGPLPSIRSLGRQAAIVVCALVAMVAVLPSERIGAAPALLSGLLVVGGLGGLVGLLPLSSWVGAASRLSAAEAGVWRIWLVPVGMVVLARVLASSPAGLSRVIQLLLVALGVSTAIFWGCAGFRAEPATRYWRVLAADVGFMCVGIASGDSVGLAAVLVLILVHWLVGGVLSQPQSGRSQLLAWLGVSGVPPFGGFTGRLLVLVGAGFLGPEVEALLLVALGLQLAACGSGARGSLRRAAASGARLGEWVGLAAGLASLVLGVAAVPALSWVFGFRL